jgi:tetratricopeptide (TPR) repeat protein
LTVPLPDVRDAAMHRLLLLLLAVLAPVALAQDRVYAGHDDALRAADSADPDKRADAIKWIASHGTQDDASVLQKHLTDDDSDVREVAEAALWQLWSRSGDDGIDALLTRGVEQMRTGELDASIATFSSIIERRPDFAEGWNKRATALFLAGEFRRSLADCGEVIKRNPAHFGALAGYGQIYFQLEQYDRAIAFWKRALQVNPNMTGVAISIKATEQLIADRRKRAA